MLKTAFEAMDTDGSGEITLDELMDLLLIDKRYASEKDKQMLRDLISAADLDGNGVIDFEEFEIMMTSTMSEIEERQEKALAKRNAQNNKFRFFRFGKAAQESSQMSKKMSNGSQRSNSFSRNR